MMLIKDDVKRKWTPHVELVFEFMYKIILCTHHPSMMNKKKTLYMLVLWYYHFAEKF